MVTIKKTLYSETEKEINIENGIYFHEIIEDGVTSKTKLDLTDDGYTFTRVVNNSPNKAIIHKEGTTSLPWLIEKYFTERVIGKEITEEEFETFKTETLNSF